jgi:hypothetical protein
VPTVTAHWGATSDHCWRQENGKTPTLKVGYWEWFESAAHRAPALWTITNGIHCNGLTFRGARSREIVGGTGQGGVGACA